MTVVMTVIGSFGHAEGSTIIVTMRVIILIICFMIVITVITFISLSSLSALVMQRMLW